MRALSCLLGATLVYAAGCANLSPLTQATIRTGRLTEEQLKNVQLFASRDITLQRHTRVTQTDVEHGRVFSRSKEDFDDVVWIRKGTPGTVVAVENGILKVSFEYSRLNTLEFTLMGKKDCGCAEELSNCSYYRLKASQNSCGWTVMYGGKEYDLINGLDAMLFYDRRYEDIITHQTHPTLGRRFGNNLNLE